MSNLRYSLKRGKRAETAMDDNKTCRAFRVAVHHT